MRNTKHTLLMLLMLVMTATITACGGDGGGDEPQLTPEEQRLLDLAGTSGTVWNATSVTFAGAPDDRFENFSLTLRGTDPTATLSYTSQNGDPVFRSSGTWQLTGTTTIEIDGNSNNVFNINSLNTNTTPATLTLSVNFISGGGVAAGVTGTDGQYVFNLEAQ